MAIGLIGRKVGMTQIFQDDGTMVGVSVLEIEPNTVTRLRTTDRDGYTAVQLGADGQKRQRLTKPVAGQLKDLPKGATVPATLREFRVDSVDDFSVGQTLAVADLFAAGDLVDVTGVSKGKGFAGHVKRHNFRRGPTPHGSDHHREPGSIGPGTTPGRVYKGLRMAGHMGDERVTVQNLEIVRVDAERNLIAIRGAIPGPKGGLIMIKKRGVEL
jgi:large subunit ribosomal protein L3